MNYIINIKAYFVGYLHIFGSMSHLKILGAGIWVTYSKFHTEGPQGPSNITRYGTKYMGLGELTPWIWAAMV